MCLNVGVQINTRSGEAGRDTGETSEGDTSDDRQSAPPTKRTQKRGGVLYYKLTPLHTSITPGIRSYMMNIPANRTSRNSKMLTINQTPAWNLLKACHHARPPKNPTFLCWT